jgi:hypothetical protein
MQTGDGPTKLVITNPIVILETNGIPAYVVMFKPAQKAVLLMVSVKKKTKTPMPSKLPETNFLLDLSPKDLIQEMSVQELILWILKVPTNNSNSWMLNSLSMLMYLNSHVDWMVLYISSKWMPMVVKANTLPTKSVPLMDQDIVMLNAHMIWNGSTEKPILKTGNPHKMTPMPEPENTVLVVLKWISGKLTLLILKSPPTLAQLPDKPDVKELIVETTPPETDTTEFVTKMVVISTHTD